MDEALEWMQRCPPPFDGACDIELPPRFEADDLDEAMTPEPRDVGEQLHEQLTGEPT